MSALAKFRGTRGARKTNAATPKNRNAKPKKKKSILKQTDETKKTRTKGVRFASKNASTPSRKRRARFGAQNGPDVLLPDIGSTPEPMLAGADDSDEEEVESKKQKFSATQNKVYCRENPRAGAPVSGYLEQGELVVVEEMSNGWVKHSKGWTQIKKGRRVYLEAFEDASPRLNKLGKTHSLGIRLLRSTKSAAEFMDVREKGNWKPLGIQNRGNTCFFNTTMQALLSSQRFVRTVLKINLDTVDAAKERVQEEIKDKWVLGNKMKELHFIEDLKKDIKAYHQTATNRSKNRGQSNERPKKRRRFNRDVIDFDRVLSRFRALYPQFDNTCEHDAQESLASFLDVCGQIKTSNQTNYRISNLFRVFFQVERELSIGRRKKVKRSQDNGYFLRINAAIDVKGKSAKIESVEDGLDYEMRWKKAESKFRDDDGEEYNFRERSLIIADKTPEQLVVQLSRFKYVGTQVKKIKHVVDFPELLDIAQYTTDPLVCNVYRLHAVLIHAGRTADSGHYYTYVRNSERKDGEIWVCNDKNVKSAKKWEKSQAYILFYVKVDDEDDSFGDQFE